MTGGHDFLNSCKSVCAVSYTHLTKEPAISSDLIRQVKGAIKEDFLQESQSAVKNLEKGLREGKQREIEASIKRADKNLKSLNPLIYTPALKELQEATEGLSVCAKSSGAGGGDCGRCV